MKSHAQVPKLSMLSPRVYWVPGIPKRTRFTGRDNFFIQSLTENVEMDGIPEHQNTIAVHDYYLAEQIPSHSIANMDFNRSSIAPLA